MFIGIILGFFIGAFIGTITSKYLLPQSWWKGSELGRDADLGLIGCFIGMGLGGIIGISVRKTKGPVLHSSQEINDKSQR